MSPGSKIVIIGGGHNGLTAAALLARAGREVVVLEARDVLGGLAARQEFHDGFSAPGLLHHTSGVRRTLIESLDLARHGLEWRTPPDIWAPSSGSRGQNEGQSKNKAGGLWLRGDQLDGDVARGDAENFSRFRGFISRLARVIRPLMSGPPPDPRGKLLPLLFLGLDIRRLGAADMTELLRVAPMPVADWMRDSFDDERLCAAVASPALHGTFTGPWSPHTATNLLVRECLAGSEVLGGPAALVDALAKAAKSHGAELRTGARVKAITLDRQATGVTGVELEDGESLEADTVLSTCDPRTTFFGLIGRRRLSAGFAADIAHIRMRGTTAKVNLAIEGALTTSSGEQVEALRTGETLDDLERAYDAVKYGRFSRRPVLDVRVPSLSDPELCPEGHHVVSILAHFAPFELQGGDGDDDGESGGGWDDAQREALGQSVVDALAAHFPDLPDRIQGREVLTPADIAGRHGVTGGHIHHGEHAPDQLAFLRPTIQCASYATPIAGLYLGGSGSHPGGGITCAPGALAARAVLKGKKRG